MARTSVPSFVTAISAFTLLAACSGDATDTAEAPAGDAPVEIKQRHDNFEAISDSFKAIRGQLESGDPDFAVLGEESANINERLQRLPGFFPEGTSVEAGYDTEALAAIWEDPKGFEDAIQNAVAASEDLMNAVATGSPEAVSGQVGNLGLNGCKACHDKFRLDDDD